MLFNGLVVLILNLVLCETYEYEYSEGYGDDPYSNYGEDSATFSFGSDIRRVRGLGEHSIRTHDPEDMDLYGAFQEILSGRQIDSFLSGTVTTHKDLVSPEYTPMPLYQFEETTTNTEAFKMGDNIPRMRWQAQRTTDLTPIRSIEIPLMMSPLGRSTLKLRRSLVTAAPARSSAVFFVDPTRSPRKYISSNQPQNKEHNFWLQYSPATNTRSSSTELDQAAEDSPDTKQNIYQQQRTGIGYTEERQFDEYYDVTLGLDINGTGQGHQGQPDTPDQPAVPDQPAAPDQPRIPGQPGAPIVPGALGQPDTTDAPGHVGVTDQVGALGYPGAPGQPGTPGQPWTRGGPRYPGVLRALGQPGYQDAPSYLGAIDQQGTQGYPYAPGPPGTLGQSETPGVPEYPGVLGTIGQPGTPDAPGYLGATFQPDTSGYPGASDQPGTLVPPEIPVVREYPALPEYPRVLDAKNKLSFLGYPDGPGFLGDPGREGDTTPTTVVTLNDTTGGVNETTIPPNHTTEKTLPTCIMPNVTTTIVTTTPTTTTTPPKFDIAAFLAIISNLTYDYETNLTMQVNETLQKYKVPTCATPTTPTTTTPSTTTIDYSSFNRTIIAKCFVCGLDTPAIPYEAHCADAFAGDFLPLVPQDPRAKGKIARFRKYCRYGEVYNYHLNSSQPRTIYGRWTGGCSVRWTDLTGIYTQRSCRNRQRAVTGLHYASKRMAKLEMALNHVDQGCIVTPVATLLPLSRGISLYARFHACVCVGNWCNRAPRWDSSLMTLPLWLVSLTAVLPLWLAGLTAPPPQLWLAGFPAALPLWLGGLSVKLPLWLSGLTAALPLLLVYTLGP